MIWRYSIDIPYADEWMLFNDYAFLIKPSWTSLFAQHNEHRLVLPKLIFSLYGYFLDFNIPLASLVNFLVFSLTVGLLFKISYLENNKAFFALFAFMAFSPLNFENHLWVFQIQWHIFLLFLLLSCHFLAKNAIENRSLIWFGLLPLAMIFSLGSGLAAGLTLVVLIALRLIFLKESRLNKVAISIFMIATVFGMAAYFTGYVKPSYHPNLVFPYSKKFWDHFGAITTLGMGNREHHFKVLCLILFITHGVFGFRILKNWTITPYRDRFLFLLATSLLAVLASISVSRAGLGASQAFSSRYYEYSTFYVIAILAMGLEKLAMMKPRYKIAIITILTISTARNYDYSQEYRAMHDQRVRGLECLKNNMSAGTNNICPEIFPVAPVIDTIRELKKEKYKFSFLKNFE